MEDLPVLIQKWNDFIENTKPYRDKQEKLFEKLFDKIDKLNNSLLTLPCDGRKTVYQEKMKSIDGNLNRLWAVIIVIIGAIAGVVWIKK